MDTDMGKVCNVVVQQLYIEVTSSVESKYAVSMQVCKYALVVE